MDGSVTRDWNRWSERHGVHDYPDAWAESARCPRCEGCGKLADTEDREPWTDWTSLPVASATALLMGLVKPVDCDECQGSGNVRPGTWIWTGPMPCEVPPLDKWVLGLWSLEGGSALIRGCKRAKGSPPFWVVHSPEGSREIMVGRPDCWMVLSLPRAGLP